MSRTKSEQGRKTGSDDGKCTTAQAWIAGTVPTVRSLESKSEDWYSANKPEEAVSQINQFTEVQEEQ